MLDSNIPIELGSGGEDLGASEVASELLHRLLLLRELEAEAIRGDGARGGERAGRGTAHGRVDAAEHVGRPQHKSDRPGRPLTSGRKARGWFPEGQGLE